MEKILTVEEKIRRAEEIYMQRHQMDIREVNKTQNRNKKRKKRLQKILKKIIRNIIFLLLILIFILEINGVINLKEIAEERKIVIKNQESIKYIQTKLNEMKQNIERTIESKSKNKKEEKKEDEQEKSLKDENKTGEEQCNEMNIGGSSENINEKDSFKEDKKEEEKVIEEKNKNFIKPTTGTISSRFGWRDSSNPKIPKNHTGIDIAAPIGTKIYSATEGEVILVSDIGGYGKHVKIKNGEMSFIYAHCNKIYVREGDKISQGQEIGEIGNTGNSTGPHLHFEIRKNEVPIDPETIMEL